MAIPITVTGLSPTFYAVCVLIVGQLALAAVAWIKGRPAVMQAFEASRKAKRADDRSDLSDCHDRLNAMDARLTKAEEERHQFELRLVETLTAYRILDAELTITAPRSPALAAARSVLSQAFTLNPSTPADMTDTVLRAM